MSTEPLRKDNHYTPRVYLKHFARDGTNLRVYRTLVSHSHIELWKPGTTKGAGHLEHLYTRIAAGGESDDIEHYLTEQYDTPAAEALAKATSDDRLAPNDWEQLIRFLTAQIVRTPAYFLRNQTRWKRSMDEALETAAQKVIGSGTAHFPCSNVELSTQNTDHLVPISIRWTTDPAKKTGQLHVAALVGRGRWLEAIKSVPNGSSGRMLLNYKWTILRPATGLSWFTSDDPVLRLNDAHPDSFSFEASIGEHGTQILLPLSPTHLLYTQVGHTVPPRGTILPAAKTMRIRLALARHAHRYVFAAEPIDDMHVLRPRQIDQDLFNRESTQWKTWRTEQDLAEQQLFLDGPSVEKSV